MSVLFLLCCAIGLAAFYKAMALLFHTNPRVPLPPDPPRKPIIGNLNDLPRGGEKDWQHWLRHKDLYGMEAFHHCAYSMGFFSPTNAQE